MPFNLIFLRHSSNPSALLTPCGYPGLKSKYEANINSSGPSATLFSPLKFSSLLSIVSLSLSLSKKRNERGESISGDSNSRVAGSGLHFALPSRN